jgi:hypothetical protein
MRRRNAPTHDAAAQVRFSSTGLTRTTSWSEKIMSVVGLLVIKPMSQMGSKGDKTTLKSYFRFASDTVAKVENRSVPKISRKRSFWTFCCCVAFQLRWGGSRSILDETIWSLTSPCVKRISGFKTFRSSPQKDFCNSIPRTRHRRPGRGPFSADAVVKVENRTTLKISRKSILDVFTVTGLYSAATKVRGRF